MAICHILGNLIFDGLVAQPEAFNMKVSLPVCFDPQSVLLTLNILASWSKQQAAGPDPPPPTFDADQPCGCVSE